MRSRSRGLRRAPKAAQKHTVYYEVLEALRGARACALCDLEAKAARRYLSNTLYENVCDGGLRRRLEMSRGYCPRHAHMLLEAGSASGVAILYEAQARQFVEFLEELSSGPFRRVAVPAAWAIEAKCPACAVEASCREDYVQTLAVWSEEIEMRQALEDGAGLCAQHLLAVLREMESDSARRRMAKAHAAKFEALRRELEEFIRKQDYRCAAEPMGPEKDSWRRAVLMMSGLRDVF